MSTGLTSVVRTVTGLESQVVKVCLKPDCSSWLRAPSSAILHRLAMDRKQNAPPPIGFAGTISMSDLCLDERVAREHASAETMTNDNRSMRSSLISEELVAIRLNQRDLSDSESEILPKNRHSNNTQTFSMPIASQFSDQQIGWVTLTHDRAVRPPREIPHLVSSM